jgi:hypothetical protein
MHTTLVPLPRTPNCANRITSFAIVFNSPRSGQLDLEKLKSPSWRIIHSIRMVSTVENPVRDEFESLPGNRLGLEALGMNHTIRPSTASTLTAVAISLRHAFCRSSGFGCQHECGIAVQTATSPRTISSSR